MNLRNEEYLFPIVESLSNAGKALSPQFRHVKARHVFPSRAALIEIVETLRSALFPGYFGETELTSEGIRYQIGAALDHVMHALQKQIQYGLCWHCNEEAPNCTECEKKSEAIVRAFISRLPQIQRLLDSDVEAAFTGDPAATSRDEAIFCYPGLLALTNQRLAHALHELNVPLIPRLITEYAHSKTGIDIHPGASIGEAFFIDHGTGVVIGETCIIGSRVRLYQGVTLGAKSFPLDDHGMPIKGIERHPIVEDDVIIYSGATILGRVTIGKGSVIGGNVWLTESVPPGSKITQK